MSSWRSAELVKYRDFLQSYKDKTFEASQGAGIINKKKAMKQIPDCPRGDREEY
jgi:hypothetical protein